jgi:TusA-related sulfurtransferase
MAAQPGETVELISTDRGSCSDVPSWAEDMGQTLKEHFERDGEFHFVLVKS